MEMRNLSKCFHIKIIVVVISLVDVGNVTANNNKIKIDDFSPDLLTSILKYLSLKGDYQQQERGCEVDIRSDLGTPQPLYIRPNTTQIFHPTDHSGILKLDKSQQIELFCSNGFSTPKAGGRNLVTVECAYENYFILNGRLFNSKEFSCKKYPYFTIRQRQVGDSAGKNEEVTKCYNNSTLLDIGFELNEKNRFIVVLSVCFNPISERTYYAKYQLTPANITPQQGFNRPKFIQSDYFPGKDINFLYSRNNQREVLATILQSDELAEELIEENGNIFISRGHLAARSDFIYASEQRSTFNYINVAPQWQSFNGLNWRAVEDGSRRLASKRNLTFDVYTGTHGVLKFNDIDGKAQAIYLDINNKKVPVPQIFYKILIEPLSESGIVLIGVNNPHISQHELQRDYVVCNDISDKVKYIKWRPKDIRRGYSYACDVNDFLKAVPHLKNVAVKSLLL